MEGLERGTLLLQKYLVWDIAKTCLCTYIWGNTLAISYKNTTSWLDDLITKVPIHFQGLELPFEVLEGSGTISHESH